MDAVFSTFTAVISRINLPSLASGTPILSTLDKLLFGVFTQLKFLQKLFKLNLWGKYPNTSISCTMQLTTQGTQRKILMPNSIRNGWVKIAQNTQLLKILSKALYSPCRTLYEVPGSFKHLLLHLITTTLSWLFTIEPQYTNIKGTCPCDLHSDYQVATAR